MLLCTGQVNPLRASSLKINNSLRLAADHFIQLHLTAGPSYTKLPSWLQRGSIFNPLYRSFSDYCYFLINYRSAKIVCTQPTHLIISVLLYAHVCYWTYFYGNNMKEGNLQYQANKKVKHLLLGLTFPQNVQLGKHKKSMGKVNSTAGSWLVLLEVCVFFQMKL